MNIKKTNLIEVQDWDDLVEKTYGRPYMFQQQEGCQDRGTFQITIPVENYSDEFDEEIPEKVNGEIMGVKFSTWLTRDPKQKLKGQTNNWENSLWWERNFYPDIQMVANDLYKKGLIEKGDYLINIDW